MTISSCRSCGSSRLTVILDLGRHPVSNALLTKAELDLPEQRYPLQMVLCEDCSLLQVSETVPAEVLYRQDYPYFSSSSPALLQHAASIADRLITSRDLGPDDLVVEVASNDGYLLRNFVRRGVPSLGIDPATGPADRANEIGVPTINDFFSLRLAEKLASEGQRADVMIANNVVAHVDAINDFVAGFARLLKPDGVAVFEFAYAVDLIQSVEFDTIYHEHLFYHTLHGLTPLFARHGLFINDVERLPIHGGSLRLFVGHKRETTARFQELWRQEQELGVNRPEWYANFAERVASLKQALRGLLIAEKSQGSRIACYGAAAKGSTMVNYLDLGPGFFEYAVDANPHKQGKFIPGQRIPICHPEVLAQDQPDLVLLLVWNFAGEVIRQQERYRKAGGRFLIPVPEPMIVEPTEHVPVTQYALQQAGHGIRPALLSASLEPGPRADAV
jgi:SAM-dependent methyltransferase